ncbi:hypothetical protein F5144DRAFT_580364 [Chaetomium tenue]|uniref:Uncharacterized protein n=1 Tax=Chaetomium tenue TaxID=1854479 RepID=A0ACB7P4J0_9PEZI|nr:hypothetical protein F5144DRAFT_580364 [Chaetomium globosum]
MASSTAPPALPALTTPFVPPPSCTDQFITTSYTSQSSVVIVLVSGPADPQFATCQPSGWDAGKNSLEFRPAVCPSGWTAYDLGLTSFDVDTLHWAPLSSAYCCSRGFSLSEAYSLIEGISYRACFQTIDGGATTASAPSSGLRVHNAWRIAWESSDITSMSPTPPQLPCSNPGMVKISSWVPGATLDLALASGTCESSPQGGSSSDYAAMIYLSANYRAAPHWSRDSSDIYLGVLLPASP